jgi:hypothetical protein
MNSLSQILQKRAFLLVMVWKRKQKRYFISLKFNFIISILKNEIDP